MIVVIDATSPHAIIGHYVVGPPTAHSAHPNPANDRPFVATASGKKLLIKGVVTDIHITLDAQNQLEVVETWKNGYSAKVLLKSVWTLLDGTSG